MKNPTEFMENWPISFRVASGSLNEQLLPRPEQSDALLTRARALTGMQKEAIVQKGQGGTCWRLLCDEGPWLNGTDLAPFPLGYFAACVAACFMSDILAQAR